MPELTMSMRWFTFVSVLFGLCVNHSCYVHRFFFHHLLLRQKWSYHFYKRCNEISALSAPDTYFSFVIRHISIKNRYHSNHVYNQFILFFSFMQNLKRTQYCFNSKGLAENQRNITSFRRKIDIFSPIFFFK